MPKVARFGPEPRDPEERFMEKVLKEPGPDGCWLWQGFIFPRGYGSFRYRRNGSNRAHRFAYEHFVGPIPKGLFVLHRCDVRHCVNPDHLFLGTQKDNIADMLAKGRGPERVRQGFTLYQGADHPSAKLNDDAVREIRRLLSEGQTIAGLARKYGVSTPVIRSIMLNLTWKHVA